MLINRGSALVSALFIMTLIAIAASAMSKHLQLDIYRTQLTINSGELYLAAQKIRFWAMDSLKRPNYGLQHADSTGKVLAYPLSELYRGIKIKGSLYDLQSRFNLNNLLDKKYLPVFARLLKACIAKKFESEQHEIIKSMNIWINPYTDDSDLNFYLKQDPAYTPGYQPMVSISELNLVRGVNPISYSQLQSFITALPELSPININTAKPALLRALSPRIDDDAITALLTERVRKGAIDLNKIEPLLKKLQIDSALITTESNYYLSVATVSSSDLNLQLYSVIKRYRDKTGNIVFKLISESINAI